MGRADRKRLLAPVLIVSFGYALLYKTLAIVEALSLRRGCRAEAVFEQETAPATELVRRRQSIVSTC